MSLALVACASSPKKDLALEQVRAQMDELQADTALVAYAPLAVAEAERSVRAAETASGDKTQRIHLIYMADRRIQIARAVAQVEQLKPSSGQTRMNTVPSDPRQQDGSGSRAARSRTRPDDVTGYR
jgi:hypothetical protein